MSRHARPARKTTGVRQPELTGYGVTKTIQTRPAKLSARNARLGIAGREIQIQKRHWTFTRAKSVKKSKLDDGTLSTEPIMKEKLGAVLAEKGSGVYYIRASYKMPDGTLKYFSIPRRKISNAADAAEYLDSFALTFLNALQFYLNRVKAEHCSLKEFEIEYIDNADTTQKAK